MLDIVAYEVMILYICATDEYGTATEIKALESKTTPQEITVQEIDLLSVSCKPGLIGSLVIGTSFTNALAWAWDKKIVGVDHLVAHLLSPLINNRELSFPYLCFLISGGHSMAVLVKEIGTTSY